jgi:hypothetical protein
MLLGQQPECKAISGFLRIPGPALPFADLVTHHIYPFINPKRMPSYLTWIILRNGKDWINAK